MAIITIQASKDAYIDEDHASTNYGSSTRLKVGYEKDSYSHSIAGTEKRALIGFDLSAIPENALIVDAHLYVNVAMAGAYTATYIYRVTGAWTENGVTWNNQPSTTSVDKSYYSVIEFSDGTGWDSDGVKTLLSSMLANNSDSMMILIREFDSNDHISEFYSSEGGYAPYLEVEYADVENIKIAPDAGAIDKTAIKMMIAPDVGAIDKNVIGMKVYDGSTWKDVF